MLSLVITYSIILNMVKTDDTHEKNGYQEMLYISYIKKKMYVFLLII